MHGTFPRPQKIDRTGMLWKKWLNTCRRSPKRIVLIDALRGTSWTAKALHDEACRLAETFSTFGPSSRIAFCLPNGADWMACFLALQKCGLAAVPLDSGLPEQACLDISRYLRCAALQIQGKLHLLDGPKRRDKEVCCIKVTSGTSNGLPKSIPCRAEHLVADGTNIIRTMGIQPSDRNLATIPLGHSYGLGNFVLPLILQGTPLVCATHFVPRQLIEWIGRYRVTVFPSVPAILRVLAALPTRGRPAPLRLAISAGAPLTADIARAFFTNYQLELHNFYGSSETGGICYDRDGDATLEGRSVGKPLAGVVVTIDRGAIRVASHAVAKKAGSWRVPDHGEWNEQGELVLRGRRGRAVNLGGKKVHPSEIEQALRSVPGITDAVVRETTHAERSVLEAVVETHLTLPEIQRILSSRLPAWKLPKHYHLLKEFPRSARGKVDVQTLRRFIQEKATALT